MKLKVKLAREYSHNYHTGDFSGRDATSFLAGFEKAKQLILGEYQDYDEYDLIQIPYSKLETLGEEEI